MKTIHEELCGVITDLEVVCGTLDTLRRRIEVNPLRVHVDDYYKNSPRHQRSHGDNRNLRGDDKEDGRHTPNNIKCH